MSSVLEFEDPEAIDGGHGFMGGTERFPALHKTLGPRYEWMARTVLEEKNALTIDLSA
jgi:hypothetical protein